MSKENHAVSGGVYRRAVPLDDTKHKVCVFCHGYLLRDFLANNADVIPTQIVGAAADAIVLEYVKRT